MPRIAPETLTTIKRDVSCVAVLEARGQVFQAHGKDVVTRCPFHDDRTPSLVVEVRKNLWRCFGACGVGGDVITLTQKLHGVSFRHAVELLSAGLPSFAAGAGASAADGVPPAQRRTARLLPCPLDATADDAHLLQQVVDFYARRLDEPGNAGRAYLAARGLADAEVIRRFALGFADRTLGLRLPNKQRKEGQVLRQRLEALGLFRASGHEHFAGSVVVPIPDASGVVGEIYGRKVTTNLRAGTPLHTYLPGPHRGVWNSGPDLVADGAVVVTEALFDALSFWVAGIRHVTAAYGVNGWTAEHAPALAAAGARDVFIAFDADAAGDAGASRLADVLIHHGYTAYRVGFPPGQDANSLLTAPDGGADALRAVLRTARWLGGTPVVAVSAVAEPGEPAPTPAPEAAARAAFAAAAYAPTVPAVSAAPAARDLPPGVRLRDDADGVHIVCGTRAYRVRGLERNRGLDVLKVNLRLHVATAGGDRFHVDTLDLYQGRLRTAFIAAAAAETGLHADVVRGDLGTLLLTLDAVQAQRAAAEAAAAGTAGSGDAAGAPAVTPEEDAQARALLARPDLLDAIVADLGHCGLVGETTTAAAAVLGCVSRLLAQPLALLVQSTSAAGKTTLMDAVLGFAPPEAVRRYSAISGKSPFYLGTTGLRHRILAIAEEEGARRAAYALKLLQSDGQLTMAATGKNPQSGKLETYDYRVEGPVMLFLTTTAIDLDPELANRCLVLTVDESPAQTAAIHAAQRAARTLDGLLASRERDRLRRLHQHAQRLLRSYPVVIPADAPLRFATGSSRLRRDHQKYLGLISAVTLLYQQQRPVRVHVADDGTRLEYLEATPADIALATQIAAGVLATSLDDLPPQTRTLWDGLRGGMVAEAQATGQPVERVRWTRRTMQERLGWSYGQTRIHLDRLVAQEYVLAQGGGHGQVVQYRLAPGLADAAQPASPLAGMTASLPGIASPLQGDGGANEMDEKDRPFDAGEAGLSAVSADTDAVAR